MRYRDLVSPPPENIIVLFVRRGEMPKLEALILTMDIRLHGEIRRQGTGDAFVNVACRNAATVKALRSMW